MNKRTRIFKRFQYHVEDLDCRYCLFYMNKDKSGKTGCGSEACRFEDIRQDAIANGRIKRKRGWFKCQV